MDIINKAQLDGVLPDRDQRRFDFERLFIYFLYKPTFMHTDNTEKGLLFKAS